MDLLIRRSGNLIDISPDGQSPLPREVEELLRTQLTYRHKIFLRGHERYTPTGDRRSIDIEVRRLYAMEQGRLTTAFGFWPKLVAVLQAAGHTLQCVDLSPPRPRPQAWEADWDNCLKHIEFRPRQQDALAAIAASWGGMVDAPPGFGKTHVFEAICHLFPHAKIDIVVRPRDVAHRIVRQLSRSLPDIGLVGDGSLHVGHRITVYMAASLHRATGDVDFLLADEAHNLVTERTSGELAKYRLSRNFGFTATRKRMDGADIRLELFFGPLLFHMSYQEAAALGLVVPIHVRWMPIPGPPNPAEGKVDIPRQRWGIWRHERRNVLIAEDIQANYSADTQILVLCDKIEHVIHLKQFLPDFEICYASLDDADFESYKRHGMLPADMPSMTPVKRAEMCAAFEAGTLRRVIATDIWATGVDFAKLQVLYRADARESETLDTQAPGRVSRVTDGKAYGEVIDCQDLFDPGFRRKSETRRRHYAKLGWEQSGWTRL